MRAQKKLKYTYQLNTINKLKFCAVNFVMQKMGD